jgi:hypothetical protein
VKAVAGSEFGSASATSIVRTMGSDRSTMGCLVSTDLESHLSAAPAESSPDVMDAQQECSRTARARLLLRWHASTAVHKLRS